MFINIYVSMDIINDNKLRTILFYIIRHNINILKFICSNYMINKGKGQQYKQLIYMDIQVMKGCKFKKGLMTVHFRYVDIMTTTTKISKGPQLKLRAALGLLVIAPFSVIRGFCSRCERDADP